MAILTREPTVGLISRPGGKEATDALTASAARAGDLPTPSAGTYRAQQWQIDSLAYYDQLGIVRNASGFWSRSLPKIRYFVGEIDDKGEIKETTNADVKAIFERIQDPGGGRSVLLSTYGQLRFLTGECYLVWSQPTADEPEQWEMLSMLELRKQSKKMGQDVYMRISAPGLNPQQLVEASDDDFSPLGDNVVVYRLWRRHPAYSMLADGPMRSVLADCEEIVRTTQSINARLISRLSGPGILAIPKSWTLKKSRQPTAGNSDNPEADPVFVELQDVMMAAIANPGSSESVVPIIVRVPDGTTGEAKLYKIWATDEVMREADLREKAIHRYALGVDMPPEAIEGLSGTNHWNAWMIDEDTWQHVQPVAKEFGEDLTGVYLRPSIKDADLGVDPEKFIVTYDKAEFVVNPDAFGDAKDLYDKRVVGKAYLRNAANAQDSDAPSDDELAEMLFAETHVAVEVKDGVIVAVEGVANRGAGTVVAPTVKPPDTGPVPPPTGESTPRAAPPEPAPAGQNGNVPPGLSASSYQILGAAEATIERARELIGGKLRSYLQDRCPECAAEVRDVPSAMVAATLGQERLLDVGTPDPRDLVDGASRIFIATAMRCQGYPEAQARALGELLELHAVRTIHDDQASLPAGFAGRLLEEVA